MKIIFGGEIEAANVEEGLISGRLVPFGEIGTPHNALNARAVVFDPGSLNIPDPTKIRLNTEHDRAKVIGKGVEASVKEDGLWMSFKMSRSTAGRDAIIQASEGLRTGLSVEGNVKDAVRKGDVLHITAFDVTGAAQVVRPAFGSAEIVDIAASEIEQFSDEQPGESETSTQGEPMTEQVTEPVAAPAPQVEAPEVSAASNLNGLAYTKPRSPIVDSKSYMIASISAAMGDEDAARWVKAADDDTTTNTGLTLPNHLNQFVTTTFGSRPAIDACGGTMPLQATGMSFTIPKLGTAPTVATTAEGAAPSETGMTSTYLTVDVVKKSGTNDVSFELLERSLPNFGDLLMREMTKAYAKNTDAYVLALLTSGGTQATATAGTVAGLQSFIATESVAAWAATGGDYASNLVINQAWWTALLAAQDTTNRPLFAEINPQNAPGRVSSQDSSGSLFGANFWVDQNATAGLVDESAFLIAPDSVAIWEAPTTTLRVNLLETGQVRIGVHGYIAATVLKAGGVRRFNLT